MMTNPRAFADPLTSGAATMDTWALRSPMRGKTYRCPDCGAMSVVQEYYGLPDAIDEDTLTCLECGDCGWQASLGIVADYDVNDELGL